MTAPASIYPVAIEDLLPRARALAEQVGGLPSRNALMRELRIGANKATKLLWELRQDLMANPPTEPVSVPEPDAQAEPDEVDHPTPTATVEPTVEPLTPAATPLMAVDVDPGSKVAQPDTATGMPTVATVAETEPVAASVKPRRAVRTWPVYLIALPAAIAIWSGWVGLGSLTGFGVVHPLPGIWDSFSINTAITLPIGVEAYAAYALKAWLSGTAVPLRARRFAKWSAIGSLVIGSAGQVAYHLMDAAGMTSAPWQITTAVSCLPVAVLGMGAALAHLLNIHDDESAA